MFNIVNNIDIKFGSEFPDSQRKKRNMHDELYESHYLWDDIYQFPKGRNLFLALSSDIFLCRHQVDTEGQSGNSVLLKEMQ